MKKSFLVLAAVLAASCSRCGAGRAVDAGVEAGHHAEVARKSVDLRTALIYVYPEYRGTATLSVQARVTRKIPGLTAAQRDQALEKLRWTAAPDGGWRLANFHLTQTAPDELTISLDYDVDQLGTLYVSPTALTSMELSLYLPRELPVGAETFVFAVHYTSSPERSAQLIRQAAQLLLGNGQWHARGAVPPPLDAGLPPPPEDEQATLVGPQDAVVTLERTGGQVHARYELRAVE